MKRICLIFIYCLGCMFVSCTDIDSDVLSEKEAKDIIEKQIAIESNQLVELVGFTKLDGVKQEAFGQKLYLMKFHLKLRVIQNANQFFLNKGSYYFISDKKLKEKLMQGSLVNENEYEKFKKGDLLELDDENLFEKTEKGWNY